MTKDEALRLALEALEDLGNHDRICPQWPTYAEPENYPKCNCGYDQAITAIKFALEAKDEPVGTAGELFSNTALERLDLRPSTNIYITPLPVAEPYKRIWVGLTDEEIKKCASGLIVDGMELARAIEAKLKEKNT